MRFLLLLFLAALFIETRSFAEVLSVTESSETHGFQEVETPFSSPITMSEGASTYETLSAIAGDANVLIPNDVLERYSNSGAENFEDPLGSSSAYSNVGYDSYSEIRTMRNITKPILQIYSVDPSLGMSSLYKASPLPALGVYQNLSDLMEQKFD